MRGARQRPTTADLALVAAAGLAVATSSPLAKMALGLSGVAIAAGRCGVGALGVLLVAPRETFRAIASLDTRARLTILVAGLLLAAHFGLFLAGLLATSLPAAVALVSLEPFMVVLAGWIAFGIRPNRGEGIGIGLAVLGGVVVTGGAGEGEHRLAGDAMVVAAAVLYGAYVMAARTLRDRLPVLPYAGAVYATAFVFLAPFAALTMRGAPPPPTRTWLFVAALGIIPTLVGHTLINRLSRRAAPSIVALVSPGETVMSIAIGAVLLGAWPSAWEWTGGSLVVLGTMIAIAGARR